jgi:hypothetical protein
MVVIPMSLVHWIHVSSVIILIGGVVFWRFVMDPSTKKISPEDYRELEEGAAAHFRPVVFAAMCLLVLSGIFNYLTKGPMSTPYHILFGVKMLLVLHVLSVLILATAKDNARRGRQLFGAAVSGMIIVLISAFLKGLA